MPDVSFEHLLHEHHADIERIIAFVIARRRLPPSDAQDFASGVWLKLVADEYDVLRKWQGRSSIRTYLTAVIQRLALDYLVSAWGRWRPSAAALRMGPVAVTLERLTMRDGVPIGEAVQALRINHGVGASEAELFAMASRLPPRRRRQAVDGVEPDETPAPPETDALEQREQAEELERAGRTLRQILDTLPTSDRFLITLRFDQGLAVSEIARLVGEEQKPLYRRIEAILRRLRAALEAAGIDGRRVVPLIGRERGADEGPAGPETDGRRPSV